MSKIKVSLDNDNKELKLPKTYSELEKETRNLFSLVPTPLQFISKDDDEITFFDEESFKDFQSLQEKPKQFRIIKSEKDQLLFYIDCIVAKELSNLKKEIKELISESKLEKSKQEYEKKEDEEEEEHKKILCHCCLKRNLMKVRYACAECNKVNFCEKCAFNNVHSKEHTLIKINTPIEAKIHGMSCYFLNNNKEINLEKGKIKISFINDGNLTLQKCFLSPISFSENYLVGNKKSVPTVEPNNKLEIELVLNKNIENKKGMFPTKWRMFTSDGIPFGDVLNLNVIIS